MRSSLFNSALFFFHFSFLYYIVIRSIFSFTYMIFTFQRNIFVECCSFPPDSRARSGAEGVIYKTIPVLGSHGVFNHEMSFSPIPAIDGFLTIDVREKPTFEEGSSVGKVKILLSSLQKFEEITVPFITEKAEKILITYTATFSEIVK